MILDRPVVDPREYEIEEIALSHECTYDLRLIAGEPRWVLAGDADGVRLVCEELARRRIDGAPFVPSKPKHEEEAHWTRLEVREVEIVDGDRRRFLEPPGTFVTLAEWRDAHEDDEAARFAVDHLGPGDDVEVTERSGRTVVVTRLRS